MFARGNQNQNFYLAEAMLLICTTNAKTDIFNKNLRNIVSS